MSELYDALRRLCSEEGVDLLADEVRRVRAEGEGDRVLGDLCMATSELDGPLFGEGI